MNEKMGNGNGKRKREGLIVTKYAKPYHVVVNRGFNIQSGIAYYQGCHLSSDSGSFQLCSAVILYQPVFQYNLWHPGQRSFEY